LIFNHHNSFNLICKGIPEMKEKGRKDSRKLREAAGSAGSQKKKTKKDNKITKSESFANTKSKGKALQIDSNLQGPARGGPALIQSSYGNKGNFELIVPMDAGGLAYYWRNNDNEKLPWEGPIKFGADAGIVDGVSLVQSDFGESGNLELAAVDLGGHSLMHFWRDSALPLGWNGPINVSKKSLVPIFSGNPSMAWTNFGCRGNFDVVVPNASGGFSHYWRDNDHSDLQWYGPSDFGEEAGIFNAVTMIQSNLEDPGNLELVARSDDRLAFFWGKAGKEIKWYGPEIIATGVSGTPSVIQSTFGNRGNFELVSPLRSGGLAHFWRDNDDPHLHWYGPFMFGMNMGSVDGVSLIQSNFGEPGHLELVAQIDGEIAFFWRDSGPDFRWNGPQYLTL
jgi:hypothetical protein